jgi:hypothetical protein
MIAGLAGQVGYIGASCYYVYLLQEVCHMFSTLTGDGDAAVLRESDSKMPKRRRCARIELTLIGPSTAEDSVPVKTVGACRPCH